MNGLRTATVIAGFCVGLATAMAVADEAYVDRARVLSVEPVYATRVVPDRRCEPSADARRAEAVTGDVRSARPGIGLGDVLRATAAPTRSCARRTERRIVGYDVTLSYGGERWVRRMAEDPGDSVPVRVRLTPAPGGSAVHRRAGR